jgi:hypothetical protein
VGAAPLVGHLLGSLAHLGTAHDPPAALALARQGLTAAGPAAPDRTRALLLHRIAFAAARAGERRECERALAAADRAFDRGRPAAGRGTGPPRAGGGTRPDGDPPWLYWFDETELAAMTGRCFAALGQPRRAEPLLRAGLDSGRIRLRSWALYAAWLAHAQLDAGEVEPACALADAALLTTVRVGSVRARRQLAALHPRLRRLRAEPAVRAYAERLHDVRRYLPEGGTRAARAG